MNTRTLGMIAVSASLLCSLRARAEVSDVIPVGGVLTDKSGAPLDGDFDMLFALYDVQIGGTPLWYEQYDASNQIHVSDGVFSAELGSLTTIDFLDLISASELWLGITVGADSEAGRIRIGSVPFALEAEYCHQVVGTKCPDGQYLTGWDESTGNAICTSLSGIGLPSGTIISFGGATAPPGYLLCDGASYLRTDYPELFLAIGTSWGAADSSHFNVPDLRGRFLRGVDDGSGRDPNSSTRTACNTGGNGGGNVGSIQAGATSLPNAGWTVSTGGNHTHDAYGGYRTADTGQSGEIRGVGTETGTYVATGGSHSHSISGGDAETRPINAYVKYVIKK